jgi:hypothetical protein
MPRQGRHWTDCRDDGNRLGHLLPCQSWREWGIRRDDGGGPWCSPPNCSTYLVWSRMGPPALGRLVALPLMRHCFWTLSPNPTNLKDFHFRATHLKELLHARSRCRYSDLGPSLQKISCLIVLSEMTSMHPSFHAAENPLLLDLSGLTGDLYVASSEAEIIVVGGRVCWRMCGGFLIGQGWTPLGPNLTPYSEFDDIFLQHPI